MDRGVDTSMCRVKVGLLTLMSGGAMTFCLVVVYLLTGHRIV